MSCECKSISCLFQLFISPSLSLSLHLPFSLPLCGAASLPFLPAHMWPLYSARIVLSSSLLISQSVILLLLLLYDCPSFHPQQVFIETYQRQSRAATPAAGGEDRVQEKEDESHQGRRKVGREN